MLRYTADRKCWLIARGRAMIIHTVHSNKILSVEIRQLRMDPSTSVGFS